MLALAMLTQQFILCKLYHVVKETLVNKKKQKQNKQMVVI